MYRKEGSVTSSIGARNSGFSPKSIAPIFTVQFFSKYNEYETAVITYSLPGVFANFGATARCQQKFGDALGIQPGSNW